jgi:hypothetical protein
MLFEAAGISAPAGSVDLQLTPSPKSSYKILDHLKY